MKITQVIENKFLRHKDQEGQEQRHSSRSQFTSEMEDCSASF